MKRKSGSRKSVRNDVDENGIEENDDYDQPKEKKGKRSKRGKTKSKHDSEESDIDPERVSQSNEEIDPLAGGTEEDAEYEVEAILDDKMVKGVHHFLIRWKGYTEESDTWEPEHTLDCVELLNEYKEKAQKIKKIGKKKLIKKKADIITDWDENEDFEVERIIDVYFHKDGKRDFLVHWKGYPSSQDTWEPEENMDCKELIKKFMAKVEEAKNLEGVETKLRVVRKQVNRLAYSMHESDRRLSRRHRGKERVRYFDAE